MGRAWDWTKPVQLATVTLCFGDLVTGGNYSILQYYIYVFDIELHFNCDGLWEDQIIALGDKMTCFTDH